MPPRSEEENERGAERADCRVPAQLLGVMRGARIARGHRHLPVGEKRPDRRDVGERDGRADTDQREESEGGVDGEPVAAQNEAGREETRNRSRQANASAGCQLS